MSADGKLSLTTSVTNNLTSAYRDALARTEKLASEMSEEQFWTRPFEYGNSFGNLTLHLTGNLNYFMGTQMAGTGYVRNREREFTDSGITKTEVLDQLRRAVELVIKTI